MDGKMTLVIVIAVVLMNLLTFVMYGIDKRKAQSRKWRIPEATLIGMSFAFGSVGACLGMKVFHHKTKHLKFKILVPLSLVLHIIIISIYIKFLFA